MRGIYVIQLPEMELDIYKIGCSKDIDSRIESFNSDTLRLYPVEVVYTKEFKEYKKAETEIHKRLNKYRINAKREFFKCDLYYILKEINEVYKEHNKDLYKGFNLFDESGLEYYKHYTSYKNMKLIIEQHQSLSPRETLIHVSNFIDAYNAADDKLNNSQDINEKLAYRDLLQDLSTIIRSGKIDEYLQISSKNIEESKKANEVID